MEKQDTPDNYEEWQARVHLHRTGVVQADDIIHNTPLAGGPDILTQNTCIATVPGNDVYKRTHHCFWDVQDTTRDPEATSSTNACQGQTG